MLSLWPCKSTGGFLPSHLQSSRDHYFCVEDVIVIFVSWDGIAEVPRIFAVDYHAPKTVLDVNLGELERLVRVIVVCEC